MEEDLSDLVDNPRETLEIELKQWMDLSATINKANIARHLAALCNHGGGYLIFGFQDDLTADQSRPSSLSAYNHDTINAIAKRYLQPSFECHTIRVVGRSGQEYPVVHVPGHGAVPICAKRHGPHDQKGRPQGIVLGAYYIRAPGPESVPISTPEQWAPVIRRCTLEDRETLFRDFRAVFLNQRHAEPTSGDRLLIWENASTERFMLSLKAATSFEWPVPLAENSYRLSYLINHQDDAISENRLKDVLAHVNLEVRDTVWTGWSMFYPFTRPEIKPNAFPENADGSGSEVLEASLIGKTQSDTTLPDFWRVSGNGSATLVRGYREDVRLTPAKAALSPETVLRETTELVQHAYAMAKHYPSATSIAFRCAWAGLEGRELRDLDSNIHWSPGRVAHADKRIVAKDYTIAQISADWKQVVTELGCPVLSLFGFDQCSRELVDRLSKRFVKI